MSDATGIKDRYGLPMSTASPQAAELYWEGMDLLLAQDFGSEEKFQQAIEADEGFALAHAALSTMLILRARLAEAKESASTAVSLAAGITPRERQQVEAIRVYINGEGPRAISLIRQHLAEYPRDALMLKIAWRLLLLGCSGAGVQNYPQELLPLMRGLVSQYSDDDWAFLGQYSFAHHETGQMEEARRYGERSDELRPNAVAAHSVAHVYFETADHPGGREYLVDWMPVYDSRAPFYVHLSWHLALFELAMGHYQRVLDVYRSEIRPSVMEKSPTSLQDSASLMWRLKIYGDAASATDLDEVRGQAAALVEGPGPGFRDVHAALAFAAAGDDACMGRLVDSLRSASDKGNLLAGEVTLPIVQGIGAFASGNYEEAIRQIEPVWGGHTRLGGSHAQREVFEDTLLEAYLRAEQYDNAEDLLTKRLKRRFSARDMFWLGRSQASNDQQEQAKGNLQGATERWQDADGGSTEYAFLTSLAETVS